MNCYYELDEETYGQTKNALEMALLMLDPENQPPQFSLNDALKTIKEAHESFIAHTPLLAQPLAA